MSEAASTSSFGKVVSVRGSCARVGLLPSSRLTPSTVRATVGRFVSIRTASSTIIAMITEVSSANIAETESYIAIASVDLLGELGLTTLISNYSEYYRLTSYFRRYTKEMIGVTMGINNLLEIFNEKYYENLEGGILESFGRLFRHSVKLYIYPMRKDAYERYLAAAPGAPTTTVTGGGHAFSSNVLVHARNVHVSPHLQNLYAHLLENHYVDSIVGYDSGILSIFSRDVLRRIKENDPTWEDMVPSPVAEAIKTRGLFGYQKAATPV